MSLLDDILTRATEISASDVHLKVGGTPVFRIDGELVPAESPVLSEHDLSAMIRALFPAVKADEIAQFREGDTSYEVENVGRFRVNAYRQRGGSALAFRPVKGRVPDFSSLSLPVGTMEAIVKTRRGLILLCGTTGAGKSTTLAALIQRMNETSTRHIITIEDPIEFLFEDRKCVIEQREIGIDTRDFPTALRQIIRQDPDVIVIGEMRDAESFRAGLGAADTGHLVLATLHAENSRQAIERILDFFSSHEREQIRRQIGMTMRAIVSQRLVPSIAGERLPVLEILRSTETVRKLFANDELNLLKTAMTQDEHDGMQTFDHAILDLLAEKRITQEVALAHADSPEALKMKLRGIFTTETRLLK